MMKSGEIKTKVAAGGAATDVDAADRARVRHARFLKDLGSRAVAVDQIRHRGQVTYAVIAYFDEAPVPAPPEFLEIAREGETARVPLVIKVDEKGRKNVMLDRETGASKLANVMRAPKKRVAVRVNLVDDTFLEGALYADVKRLDGTTGSVADRLHHPFEKYLPLAVEQRHILLNKSKIVTVELFEGNDPIPRFEGIRRFDVELRLLNGRTVRGAIYAILSEANSRVLDYLNTTGHQFMSLAGDRGTILVNSDYILGVTEMMDDA